MKKVLPDDLQKNEKDGDVLGFCKYIVPNGKRINPKNASCFKFLVSSKN
jgi:hypothetical protein